MVLDRKIVQFIFKMMSQEKMHYILSTFVCMVNKYYTVTDLHKDSQSHNKGVLIFLIQELYCIAGHENIFK